jgi:hypothetical protein
MASLTVTPLNNGITLTLPEVVSGMVTISTIPVATIVPAYLYYTSTGDIYYQSNSVTPATLLLSAGFPITCAATAFDGTQTYVFLGGSGGNYVFGAIDTAGVSTLATATQGTLNFSAITFNLTLFMFVFGTADGLIYSFDQATSAFSLLQTLTAAGLPSGSTLVVSTLTYDLTFNKYLIIAHASANINDVSNPGYAAQQPNNFSIAYYGVIGTLVEQAFTGVNLWLGAIGQVENSSGVKVIKLVAAGEDSKMYHSDDGITWTRTLVVDQTFTINSLTFNTWVFVGGLLYGVLLMSTNGTSWESSYDAALFNDIVEVIPA